MGWFRKVFGQQDRPEGRPAALVGETILVVDPSIVIQKVMQLSLQGQGCRVLFASTADEALPLVAEERPTVVFVATEVTGRQGDELFRSLESAGPAAPAVVLLKGTAEQADPTATVYDAVFDKPFPPEKLIELLARLRESRAQ